MFSRNTEIALLKKDERKFVIDKKVDRNVKMCLCKMNVTRMKKALEDGKGRNYL